MLAIWSKYQLQAFGEDRVGITLYDIFRNTPGLNPSDVGGPIGEERDILTTLYKFAGKKKGTIKELQKLTGHLNFLCHAIVLGRTFTRRMYSKFLGKQITNAKGIPLKPFHHVSLDGEFRRDCRMWINFLEDQVSNNRPFLDLAKSLCARKLNFFSDASANSRLGFGAIFGNHWLFGQWEENFIDLEEPMIGFLELYVLCVAVFMWSSLLQNTRIVVFCDNESVVYMMNNMTSSCKFCMELLRRLTLDNLHTNRRVFAQHIKGKNNILSDALSRLKFKTFFDLAPQSIDRFPKKLLQSLWPLSRLWNEIKQGQY